MNVASKKDSQDLCFLGNSDYRTFLTLHAPDVMQAGPIVRQNGDVLGEHNGLSNYTIGQRKKLGVSFSEPLYVLAMNPYKNALVVGTRDELGGDTLTATRVTFDEPQRDISPGQGAVLYDGDVCLGGGNIEKFEQAELEIVE